MSGHSIAIAWRIARPKITDYLLNPASRDGASKARYLFRFGFTSDKPDALALALIDHAVGNLPGAVTTTRLGMPVVIFKGPVNAPDGRPMPLRAIWAPHELGEMHFVTAIPLTR